MKTILCYGDSLTWGYDAASLGRHALEDRWPSVLKAALDDDDIEVIAEGLNGRTTAFDDHLAGADRNGARLLPTVLTTHAPIDIIVIMLGANDMKPWIHGNPVAAKQGSISFAHTQDDIDITLRAMADALRSIRWSRSNVRTKTAAWGKASRIGPSRCGVSFSGSVQNRSALASPAPARRSRSIRRPSP